MLGSSHTSSDSVSLHRSRDAETESMLVLDPNHHGGLTIPVIRPMSMVANPPEDPSHFYDLKMLTFSLLHWLQNRVEYLLESLL